ncbi:hypothetical protein RRG08_058022 [Elysia crispata]|uniref:Homeobox domain-containing protein n=1 Tax=Elysia crispata TaxID=231223 RepID=A0AAE1E304_9GAST|nr:hypothetical protein RRG08_058022 [Elysia crispata]
MPLAYSSLSLIIDQVALFSADRCDIIVMSRHDIQEGCGPAGSVALTALMLRLDYLLKASCVWFQNRRAKWRKRSKPFQQHPVASSYAVSCPFGWSPVAVFVSSPSSFDYCLGYIWKNFYSS